MALILLSDQKVGQIVSAKARKVSQDIYKSMATTLGENDHKVVQANSDVDIYNPEEKEILLFDDGIQVKAQKAERQPKLKQCDQKQNYCKAKNPAIITDIVILPTATAKFEYIAAPINANGEDLLSLASVTKAKILQEYGRQMSPLNLVAITDGARTIRHRLLTIFGLEAIIILEEYHLGKKLRALMSMIATNKLEKTKHLKFLFSQLWHGSTAIALEYLKHQVQTRNLDKWQELIGYARKTSTRNHQLQASQLCW